MDGLITIIVLLLLALLIVPVFIAASTSSKVSALSRQINVLQQQLNEVLKKSSNGGANEIAQEASTPKAPEILPAPDTKKKEVLPETKPVVEKPEITPLPAFTPKADANAQWDNWPQNLKSDQPVMTVDMRPTPPQESIPSAKRKSNLEQFIGEKLMSLIGIGILVLGIFFLVRWAVSKNLITDAGKILIGIGSGTLLLGVAHRLHRNYRAFSSILAGGGVAVLYFSVYQAYQSYHLLPQAFAFTLMLLITGLAVLLSVFYDKQELAYIALLGGFASPFMVSDGSGNFKILFTYLLILNVGMFVLSVFKKWPFLYIVSYVLTILVFGAWAYDDLRLNPPHAWSGFLFASLFFLTFFGTQIVHNIRTQQRFRALDFGILLSNSGLYFGVGLLFLQHIDHGAYKGYFTLALAVVHFLFAFWFYKTKQIDSNLVYLLIGLVLTFISLVAPIQLDGNSITLFWACEMVLLYWLASRSGISLIRHTSVIILFAGLISLVMDWNNAYYQVAVNPLPVVFNKAFITTLVMGVALFLKDRIYKQDGRPALLGGYLPSHVYTFVLQCLIIFVLFTGGWIELRYQVFQATRVYHFINLCSGIYLLLWTLGFVIYALVRPAKTRSIFFAWMTLFVLSGYLYLNLSISKVRDLALSNVAEDYFQWHYLAFLLAIVNVAGLIGILQKMRESFKSTYRYFTGLLLVAIVSLVSLESTQVWVYYGYEPGFSTYSYLEKAIKIAWPILWSLISLVYMLSGMWTKRSWLRIMSLALFCITILKLFIHDISNVSQGGKIAAFIILGLILLVVSFMYQKIKGLFKDVQ
ncbi:MAG: DUF2339 domain-containing protein [Chitinophagaceae bacterium]|nr:DUF2339 domain-containing protein [Chitinophagaceae bacterium]